MVDPGENSCSLLGIVFYHSSEEIEENHFHFAICSKLFNFDNM